MRTLFASLLACCAFAAHACEPSQFVVVQDKARLDRTFTTIVGQVRNDNPMACGVELQAVFSVNGVLVGTFEGWPAHIRNIEPGEVYSFTMQAPLNLGTPRGVVYTLKPLNARTWSK
jgi:hypothetical protein